MNVYLVIQEGVYRHNIVGVFTCEVDAVQIGVKMLHAEPDDYHSYSVYEIMLDSYIEIEKTKEILKYPEDDNAEKIWILHRCDKQLYASTRRR